MQSIARKLLVIATAIIAVVLPVTAGGGHATAGTYPSANNLKRQYLTSNPAPSMAWGSVQRRIYLTSGTYVWHTIPTSVCRREMYLGSGWYTWTDNLVPKSGYYKHYSYLNPDNPAWGTATLGCTWNLNKSGTWTWGSALLPQF